jgi:peptidoglycan/xylan/chitin deacetylase (PgdA/CDA1 family)
MKTTPARNLAGVIKWSFVMKYYLKLILFVCVLSSAHISQAKTIALSFDDAPRGDGPLFSGEQRSQELLAKLDAHSGVPSAFFVTTQGLKHDGNKERIHRYADAGHIIANHSHTHQWLHKSDSATYIQDIQLAEGLLSGYPNRRPWYRFPYLDEGRERQQRNNIRVQLDKLELMNGYVTVDNYDWYIESKWQQAVNDSKLVDMDALRDVYITMLMSAVNFYDELAIDVLGRSPHHVLLLHENDLAAVFIGDLIDALKADGWEIVSPDKAYQDEIADYVPNTLRTGQGRVAAIAHDKHALSATNSKKLQKRLSHLAIEEALIDQLIRDKKCFRDNKSISRPI